MSVFFFCFYHVSIYRGEFVCFFLDLWYGVFLICFSRFVIWVVCCDIRFCFFFNHLVEMERGIFYLASSRILRI
jgi:hypothetical protein